MRKRKFLLFQKFFNLETLFSAKVQQSHMGGASQNGALATGAFVHTNAIATVAFAIKKLQLHRRHANKNAPTAGAFANIKTIYNEGLGLLVV